MATPRCALCDIEITNALLGSRSEPSRLLRKPRASGYSLFLRRI